MKLSSFILFLSIGKFDVKSQTVSYKDLIGVWQLQDKMNERKLFLKFVDRYDLEWIFINKRIKTIDSSSKSYYLQNLKRETIVSIKNKDSNSKGGFSYMLFRKINTNVIKVQMVSDDPASKPLRWILENDKNTILLVRTRNRM